MTAEAVRAPSANSAGAPSRWLRLGPWYAMFPMEFAFETIQAYTAPGDRVLDPFLGRGTTLAAARALGRSGTGCEINPVAWVYAATKLDPAPEAAVLARLGELEAIAAAREPSEPGGLEEFFRWAFCPGALHFLTVARSELDWKACRTDRTLMALLLVDLHGNAGHSFSNQMRQTKSMSPEWSVAWWKERGLAPEPKDVPAMLRAKIAWRYRYGTMTGTGRPRAILGDSTVELARLSDGSNNRHRLLLTSPPYHGLVNYDRDQWLRRWLLGGPWSHHAQAVTAETPYVGGFDNKAVYRELLQRTFAASRRLLTRDATLVVRTDAREFTLNTTAEVLGQVFPEWTLTTTARPHEAPVQTRLFGDRSKKPGEVDVVLRRG